MQPSLILMHSPFLGPATWQPAAQVLEGAGRRARMPSLLAVARSGAPHWPAGVETVVRSAAVDPVILVPHSNAGLYVPAVIQALGDQVRGVVFVDASIPGAGHHTPRDFLNRLAIVDGLLPPWTSWWDEADVAQAIPDPQVRAEVEAEQPRMPLTYYDHLPPAPTGWDTPPCGLIWFGKPYDMGAAHAAMRAWPTLHMPGGHLHMLNNPSAVAEAVLRIAGDWS